MHIALHIAPVIDFCWVGFVDPLEARLVSRRLYVRLRLQD